MSDLSTIQPIIGQKISKIWCGYAAVIFLELGELYQQVNHSAKGDFFTDKGQFIIMIEGDWFLKKNTDQLLQRFTSTYAEIEKITTDLIGLEVNSINLDEKNNDIVFKIGSEYFLTVKEYSGNRLVIFKKNKLFFAMDN